MHAPNFHKSLSVQMPSLPGNGHPPNRRISIYEKEAEIRARSAFVLREVYMRVKLDFYK